MTLASCALLSKENERLCHGHWNLQGSGMWIIAFISCHSYTASSTEVVNAFWNGKGKLQ